MPQYHVRYFNGAHYRAPVLKKRPVVLGFVAFFSACALGSVQAEAVDSAEDVVMLESMKVTASGDSDVTEGTGSYTTGAAGTATPLDMSLRQTPQSVSVITRQRIEDQDLQTVMDVVNNAVGVSVNRYETNRAQFNARGFDINSLMIDNVPTIWEQPWSSGEVFSSLIMYDRVELVRGANGLMTGVGDPSAAINLVHKRANSAALQGTVALKAGTWDTVGAEADVSTALNQSGTVRGRLVGEYSDGDSWVDLLSTNRQTFYGTVDIDLNPDTVVWFGVSHQATETDSPMWGGLPVWYADGTRTNWDRSKTSAANWSSWDSTYDNYFANLEHRFDNGWQARISYSHGVREADSFLFYVYGNPDKDPATTEMFTWPGAYQTRTTQDDYSLQLNGPFDLMGRRHELAVGYIHSRQTFDAKSRAPLTGFDGIADFENYAGSFPEPIWGELSFYEDSETTQQGVYGVARFSVMDPLTLIVGSRVSDYEKTGRNVYVADAMDIEHSSEVTPYAGLVYDFTDAMSAYVSYTNIFLPQSERDIRGQYLDPIVGNSTETGIKGEFLNGRLNVALAVFRIEQDNLAKATGELIPNTVGEMAYITSEGATSQGYEFEVSGEVAQGWNASVGFTQFEAEDAEGDDVNTLYPRKLLRTFTTYRLPGALNKLTLGGGVNWQSDIETVALNPSGNSERIVQKAYSLVNLMARYDITPQLSAQLNANNVLDEEYFDVFDAYGALTYGAPQSVTASARYKF